MKDIASERSSVLVLERGEELMEVLNAYAQDKRITGAWLSGLGAASDMTIGYYDLENREYVWTDINDGIVEIISLTGNLSCMNGEPLWHVHGMFSGTDLRAFGGHVKTMNVGLTCELYITNLEYDLLRNHDESTGLNLLDPLP